MPEVTPFEMRRLQTIRENHLMLKELCGPGDSVYEFQNSRALLDAALALKTGRVRTPTPPGSSTTDSSGSASEDKNLEHKGRNRCQSTRPLIAEVEFKEANRVLYVGDSGGETKRELRVRRKKDCVKKGSQHSSEEGEESDDDTDEEYAVGYSSSTSLYELEASQSDKEEEEEFEDSDKEDEENEDALNGEGRSSKESIVEELVVRSDDLVVSNDDVVVGTDNPMENSTPSHLEDSLKKAYAEKATPEPSQQKFQANVSMEVAGEINHDKDGFEKWGSGRKSKRKPNATQKVVAGQYEEKKTLVSENMSVPTRPTSVSLPKSNLTRQTKDRKKKSTEERKRLQGGEGTVVITKEEYELLQRLKKNSLAVLEENCNDELNVKCQGSEKNSEGKEQTSHTADLGQQSQEGCEAKTSPEKGVAEEGEHRRRAKAKQTMDAEASQREHSANGNEEHSLDSEFQRLPKKRLGSGRTAAHPCERRRGSQWSEPYENNVKERAGRVIEGGGLQSRHNTIHIQEEEVHVGVDIRNRGQKTNQTPRKSKAHKAVVEFKAMAMYPFQETVKEDQVHSALLGGPIRCATPDNTDDDFEEPLSHDRGTREMLEKQAFMESKARANRKREKAQREVVLRKREAAGEKPYYIMVSASGTPYGDGMTAWKAELNKLCRALDPSVRDIRQQPHHEIQILKKRLTDNFDYSGVVFDRYLLPLIGHRLSTRRNELMNKIRAGLPCPPGVKLDQWDRLKRICGSLNFKKKSAAMRYANSCRQSVGRAGPGGEIGVRDSLKQTLRRSPDPDEVQAEMIRDKGYSGKKRKTKKMAIREKVAAVSPEEDEEDSEYNAEPLEESQSEEVGDHVEKKKTKTRTKGGNGTSTEQMELMEKLQAEILELKGRIDGKVCQPSCARTEAPSTSMAIMPLLTSFEGLADEADRN